MTTPSQPTGDRPTANSELDKLTSGWERMYGQSAGDNILDASGLTSNQIKEVLRWHNVELSKFAAAIIAGGPEKRSKPDGNCSNWAEGVYQGHTDAVGQYQAAVATALEAFLGGGK